MDIKLECLDNLTDLLKRFGREVEGEVSLRPREDNASARARQTHLSRPTLSKGGLPFPPISKSPVILPFEEKAIVILVHINSHFCPFVISVEGESIVPFVEERPLSFF